MLTYTNNDIRLRQRRLNMANLEKILDGCIKKGNRVLEKMRETSFAPNNNKILMRRWSLKDAAELVGVSTEAIRKAENANKIPKLGTSSKSKKREFSFDEISQLRKHFKTSPSKGEDGETCITAFINFKGGVYKSTTSTHFAQHMALQGYKVLFIDADSQATSTQYFGYTPDDDELELATIDDCLTGRDPDLSKCIIGTPWQGLDLIPACLSLYDAEIDVPYLIAQQKIDQSFYTNLKQGLEDIKDNYDVVVIDAPPSLGIINLNVICAANSLVIPVPPLFADFSSTLQFFTMLRETMTNVKDKSDYKFIKLLITKFDGKDESKAFVKIIRHVFGQNLTISNIFSNTTEIPRASQNLETIYEVTDFKVKKTYDRALSIVDRVNREIEEIIKTTWPAYSEELLEEGVF